MKLLTLAAVVVAAALAGLVLVLSSGAPDRSVSAAPHASAAAPGATAAADRELAAGLEAVHMRLDDLVARLEALERGSRAPVDELAAPALRPDDDWRAEPGAVSPQEWLRRYVASFAESDEGEELYRMHVRAELSSLLQPVAAIVASPAHVEKLRTRLAELLDKPKFAAHGRVVDALFAALLERGVGELSAAALQSLAAIGGRAIARLENALWSIESRELRHAAIQVVLRADPRGPDIAVERLFQVATDPLDRAFLLSLLEGAPLEAALATVRAATNADVDVRLAAAEAAGELHGEPVVALVRWWLGFERDERVRAALGAAEQSASQVPSYHAKQACGPPNARGTHDDPAAWACQQSDGGEQWLELRYEPPLRAERVVVHEIGAAGGVRRIVGYDEAGAQHELWRGVDPNTAPGPAEFTFAPTQFRVQRVRLVIDTSARSWWEEIDAVELAGPEGSAWAVDASASSNYGS